MYDQKKTILHKIVVIDIGVKVSLWTIFCNTSSFVMKAIGSSFKATNLFPLLLVIQHLS